MAPRLCLRGVVANPRDATEHRCGLRLATKANPLAHKYRKASNTALARAGTSPATRAPMRDTAILVPIFALAALWVCVGLDLFGGRSQ